MDNTKKEQFNIYDLLLHIFFIAVGIMGLIMVIFTRNLFAVFIGFLLIGFALLMEFPNLLD